MQDLLLAAVAAAIAIFGWFLMKRLDSFLEKNHETQAMQPEPVKNILRIGFSDPSIADSINNVLDRYSRRYSGIPVYLFHGTEKELIKQLSENKLNMIFLPEDADIPVRPHYNVIEAMLGRTPVMMKCGGLPIEPIVGGRIIQKVLWPEGPTAAFAGCFAECLKDELDAPKPQS